MGEIAGFLPGHRPLTDHFSVSCICRCGSFRRTCESCRCIAMATFLPNSSSPHTHKQMNTHAHAQSVLALFPVVGLQTPGEVIEANFGETPFVFDFEGMLSVSPSSLALPGGLLQGLPRFPLRRCSSRFDTQLSGSLSAMGRGCGKPACTGKTHLK